MAANIYLRGRTWWWRWRPCRRSSEKFPITLRISLRTGCAVTAQRYAVQLEAQLDGLRAMKHFQIGRDGLESLYKAVSERAVDRIIGDRLSYPSVFHDRIDLAQARMYALSPTAGEPPSLSLALEALQTAGVDEQDILDVIATLEAQDGRSLITDGQLSMHLKSLGYPVTSENLARARPTAVAAMARACLLALSGTTLDILGIPIPPAMALFDQPVSDFQGPAVASQANSVCLAETRAQSSGVIQGSFGEAAEVVIKRQLAEGLWDDDRAREVRASVNLFIGANGDIAFSSVRQSHLFDCVALMTRLPKRYNHFMVKGQGGFAAALASVAAPPLETPDEKAARLEKVGVHSGTRNKHLTWLKAVIEGAAVAGFAKHSLNFTSLRHNAKQMKKTDKRKKNEKRPNWTAEAFAKLTSGPVYEGCAGINNRFKPGPHVIHDGVYFSPLVNLNICGRPSEGAGLEAVDVFPDAPIPYIHVRENSLRGLKVEDGERKVAIHQKLIEIGLLEYVLAQASDRRRAHCFLHHRPLVGSAFFGPLLLWCATAAGAALVAGN